MGPIVGDRPKPPGQVWVFVRVGEAVRITAWKEGLEHIAGGRVDSPPTFHQGRLLFGSHDGWVYCLRAADGALIWRFRALPDRLMCAYGQVESAWPVCGFAVIIVSSTSTVVVPCMNSRSRPTSAMR